MKLSTEVKRKITEDWNKCYPDLGIYKPLWLLRRIGPLLCGICLNRDSGNDAYCPTFHTHNLLRQTDVVTLTLADPLRKVRSGVPDIIRAIFHEQRFSEAAERLRRQVLIPLSGPVHLSDCLSAYREYMDRPLGRYPLSLFEDLVTMLVWCDRCAEAEKQLREFQKTISRWPEGARPAVGAEAWANTCRSWVKRPEDVRLSINAQVLKLGIQALPHIDFS
jgi:hypothetical protein